MFVVTTARTVSAAALPLIPPPPTPPGPPNTDPIYGRDTFADPLPSYASASGNYLYLAATVSGQLFPWGLQTPTNAGTIYLRDEAGYYGDLRLGPQWAPIKAFANTGTVVLHLRSSIGGTVVALADGGSDGIASSVVNGGQVFLISDHFDSRFYLSWQSRSSVVNSGLIALSTPEGSSIAIELVNGGTVRNDSGGQILVEGVEASGILIHAPVLATDGSNPTELVNAGRIEVRSSGVYASYGVWIEFGEAVNSGTVTADIAFALDGKLTNAGTICLRRDRRQRRQRRRRGPVPRDRWQHAHSLRPGSRDRSCGRRDRDWRAGRHHWHHRARRERRTVRQCSDTGRQQRVQCPSRNRLP